MAVGMRRSTWTRLAVLACVAGSILGGLVHVADAAGKPGMVKAKGGYTFQGQVDEDAVPGKVIVIQANGQKVELFKQAIDSIVYFNTPREEFDARLAILTKADVNKKDVAGRVALARWALTNKEPALAAEALQSAKAIDPNNRDVVALEKEIATAMPPPPPVKPDVATQPATQPAAEKPAVTGPAIRTLTNEELQLVRIREMKPGEKLRATVPAALRKDVVAAGLVQANQIGRMSVPDLAALVLAEGTPAMKEQVKILSDPASLTDYKMKVNKIVVSGCAAANCHGSAESKSLRLFAQGDETSVLTNFVILQKTDRSIDNVRRLMIDRANPRNSLLLAYLLPQNLTQVPHPEVPGFKAATKTANDPAFVAINDWITNSLKVILAEGYGDIDLSKPPPDKKSEKAAAGR